MFNDIYITEKYGFHGWVYKINGMSSTNHAEQYPYIDLPVSMLQSFEKFP